MSETPTLSAPGIVLRPLVISDAPALFIALSDPEVQLYRRADAHADVSETEAYIADTRARAAAAWAITEDGGEALGRLALRVTADVGEFGIVLRRAAHRKGLGFKALSLAQAYAFGPLHLTAVRADIDAENAASIALFTRAGFHRAAYLPAHRTTKLGVRDSVIMERRRPV